ncbi:ABC transporter permease subunit [Arthrobacter sp. B0490]|uniref:ABC transporter permease subunit n=1 Tax=Arthrobacter sp. B0490 TaxID=2058891 RepID=UPI000CE37885|nr:ABC transporter permease subunit [Arthrobacter sp. B0490]
MASTLPLVRHAVQRSRVGLVGWSAGVVAASLLYLPIYPSMGASGQLQSVVSSLPAELVSTLGFDSITTGAGYAQATLLGLIGFVLLTIAAVGWGAAAIGGEEESGALELTLAHGVTRPQVALEAALALGLRLAVVCGVLLGALLALDGPSELGIPAAHAVVGTFALYLLSLLSGLASLTAGALTGSRTASIAAGAAVAVLGYAFNALGNQAEAASWVKDLSPYDWAFSPAPLANGLGNGAAGGMAVILGLCGILVVAAVVGLSRRDIGG